MPDIIGGYESFIGIFNAHEPFHSCRMTITEMASIRTKLKDYVRNRHSREIKVWNLIDNITSSISDQDINRIMDVAVTWQYCIADSEATCEQSRNSILNDRARINNAGLDETVELVHLFQTFAIPGSRYSRMPTAEEMYNWGCDFLQTDALDGLSWYTWDASWYPEDLGDRPDLWPTMSRIYNECAVHPEPSPTLPPSQPKCFGSDSIINTDDILAWASNYLTSLLDINNDEKTNASEFAYLLSHWQADCQY
jgi:hypothetical protein